MSASRTHRHQNAVYLTISTSSSNAYGDYEPSSSETTRFFQIIQNKLHFAVTGKTAAELIKERANAELPNMGLTAWKGDQVRKSDVTTAKNYLNENEISGLNRIVTMWLDFAEDQAQRRKQVFMKDWEERLDDFLRFNDRSVLTNAGSVSRSAADQAAKDQYNRYEERRRRTLEQEGEDETIRALEETAQKLPGRKDQPS